MDGVCGAAQSSRALLHFVPLVAGLIRVPSIYFVYVMAVHLPVWCPWCLAAHIGNGLLFLMLLAGWPWRAKEAGMAPYPSTGRAMSVLAGCGGFGVLVMAAIVAMGAQMTATKIQGEFLKVTNNVDYIEWRWRYGEARDIPIRSDDHVMGSPDAKKRSSYSLIFSVRARGFSPIFDSDSGPSPQGPAGGRQAFSHVAELQSPRQRELSLFRVRGREGDGRGADRRHGAASIRLREQAL
jgi:hypothetical protein